MDARERYLNDPIFHNLVDMMYNLIRDNEASITELRQAVVFAATKYAMENPAAIFMAPGFLQIGGLDDVELVNRNRNLRDQVVSRETKAEGGE